MKILIDWLSYSFDISPLDEGRSWLHRSHLDSALKSAGPDTFYSWIARQDWIPGGGRTPYNQSIFAKGLRVYSHPALPHALMEVSGEGCETLLQENLLQDVLQTHCERLTRLDCAVDIPTQVKPSEFAKNRVVARFKAMSTAVSSTGETVYIGSRKSDRYARVYRYNPPHPRHDWLRIEHVYRGKQAKVAGRYALAHGVYALAGAAGTTYGWEHPCWNFQAPENRLIAWRPENKQTKTEAWLISQVAPAFQRLVRDGIIDNPQQWLDRHFIPQK
jgi:hypothetical protein